MGEEHSLAEGWSTWGDHLSRRLWLLQSESLLSEARRGTGLDDFGNPPIKPALSLLVKSLELEADLHPLGRVLIRAHLRGLLETRLRLTQRWSRRLEMESSIIERPIFITGLPRSGSAFLHELLAEDPENRVPEIWEVMFPIPIGSKPPKKVDPRVQKAEASLWWFRRLAPGRIRFTRSARLRRMNAWRSIVIPCPKKSSRPVMFQAIRLFYTQPIWAQHIGGRSGSSSTCKRGVQINTGFSSLPIKSPDQVSRSRLLLG